MLKRHSDQIWARLDELYVNRTVFIGWAELYHWYNLERIHKKPWRDLKIRWEELLEEKNESYVDPQIAEGRDGVSLFFSKDPATLTAWAK